MDYIIKGLLEALKLLFNLNSELYTIIVLSIVVSISATLIAAISAIPTGIFLGITEFKGKKIISRILYSLMSIPSVVVGLVVAIILSRRGPLGFLELMYTPTAMIAAQAVLVFPLITGLTYTLTRHRGKQIDETVLTLGAGKIQRITAIAKELKLEITANVITTFSRAISEVGAVMIVGGNIKDQTRVITTSIAMSNSMGNYASSIALGLVLLTISFIINSIVYSYYEF